MVNEKNNLTRLFTNPDDRSTKLITYFPLGDPTFDTVYLADVYLKSGADVLEMGIAVPDPYMDGAVVSGSMERTRIAHTTEECLILIKQIRENHPDVALEIFCYKQLLDIYPVKELAKIMDEAHVDGILVADNTLEQNDTLRVALPNFVSVLGFLPFTATDELSCAIAKSCDGFVFLQAVDGPTGVRENLEPALPQKVKIAKRNFGETPVCPGFGISTPDHCAQVRAMGADGLIIGSETLKRALKGEKELSSYLRSCKKAMA